MHYTHSYCEIYSHIASSSEDLAEKDGVMSLVFYGEFIRRTDLVNLSDALLLTFR